MNPHDLQLNNKFMEYIVALEKYQSISAAAEAMFISQPAMSHFLNNLESRLGTKLFNRVRGRYIPTYEGERYLYYARKIMYLESQLENEFAEMKNAGYGKIRLALPTLRSAYILPNLVARYRELYPHVRITLQEAHSSLLERMLLNGEVDFAILNAPAKSNDTVSLLIRYDEVLLAVPQNHPCASAGTESPSSAFPSIDISLFRSDPFIFQYPDQRTRQTADRILSQAGIQPNILLETRSIETALKMVSKGLGICFAPETYVHQLKLENPPVYFSLGGPTSIFGLSLAYLKSAYLPVYFQDFISVVKEVL